MTGSPFAGPAWGEELYAVAQAEKNPGETAEASQKAEKKLTGFTDRVMDTVNSVSNWVSERALAFKSKVDGVFGFEKGEGPQAFFGSVFYFFIFLVLLFFLMFIYNIIRDFFTGVSAKSKYKATHKRRR